MPIPWLVVLQSVPWTEVIKNAPKVAEGAKKLWSTVSNKSAVDNLVDENSKQFTPAEGVSIAQLHERIAVLEKATDDLHNQMLASSELIKTLAEQNTQLVRHIEINSRRVAWLTGTTIIFGLIALMSLYFLRSH